MMPLAIHIDASDYIQQSALTTDEIDGFKALLLDRLADGFQEQWTNQVNENLHSTRPEYLKGMFVSRPDPDTVIMGVTARKSQLAVDLELGKDAFDEKQGFEQSPKRTEKKNGGWFLTIPFRWAVPTALGESAVFANQLPMALYKIAKTQDTPVRKAQLPGDLAAIPPARPAFNSGGKSFGAYQHKTSIYESLVRVPDRDQNRGQYMTFRRVSDLSDPNSWIHPGFLPHNLLGKALAQTDVESIVRKAKIDFFKNTM
jgi:hypothetical protein